MDVYVTPCAYCGMPAGTVDHTTPQTALARAEHLDPSMYPSRPLVDACRECNSTLGDRYFPTLAARKAYVKERYRAKYAKLIETPKWSDGEMSRLGDSLRSAVAQTQEARRLLMARLAW